MNDQNTRCSDELLLKLLHSDQDGDDDHGAAAHLEHCPRCQARIEALAAEPRDWQCVQESLSSDEANDANAAIGFDDRPCGVWATKRWQRVPSAWTDSMARQLLAPPSHPEMLGRIGRYEVERVIGSGGMGVVFKAFDTELNRPVAVKVLAPYLAGSGAARKRFAREARAAAAIVHEHVVAIHNVETEGDSPFLVMHYVAGESLQQRLDREGPLELCEILRIGLQTAAGLAAAHAQGLVHRDVKPSNILLELGIERTLLTDFGLARASDDASLTQTGFHPGTPQYMSPEQARGDTVDARSDLFSLGSVVYAMCTGRSPFRAETSYGILRRITDTEPRSIREINPQIPEWLEQIVSRLLSKSLESRFQTAEHVSELLKRCLAHVQQPTTVALPDECRALSPSANKLFPTPRVVAAIVIVTGCFVAGIYLTGGLMRNRVYSSAAGVDARSSNEQPKIGESSGSSSQTDPEMDWNLIESDVEAFGTDFEPFEKSTRSLWERSAIQGRKPDTTSAGGVNPMVLDLIK